MSRFCLDTSAYSHFKRGDPAVVELIDGADWIGVPAVVVGELWIGFLQGDRLARNQAELRDFLAVPVVEELVVDRQVARAYAEIIVALRRDGNAAPFQRHLDCCRCRDRRRHGADLRSPLRAHSAGRVSGASDTAGRFLLNMRSARERPAPATRIRRRRRHHPRPRIPHRPRSRWNSMNAVPR